MREMSGIKKITVTAICVALCVIVPIAFHMIPNGGAICCPMHLPVLVCGLVCGWQYGLLCGLMGPVLSCLLTGMPGIGYLPFMMVEMAVYGLLTGVLIRVIRSGKLYVDLYASLIIAMIAGRIVAGIVKALVLAPGEMTIAIWVTSYFVMTLPGILIQLVFVPNIVAALMKAQMIPVRYLKENKAAV